MSAKERGPMVRALLLVPGSPNIELVTIAEEKVSPPFSIGASGLSGNIFPGTRTFNLAVKMPSADSGFKKVASVVLPETGSNFLLLLEPQDDKSLIPHVIPDSLQRFGADSTLFFNASSSEIGAIFGTQRTLIRPRRVEIVSAPPAQDDVPFYQTELYHRDNEKFKLFASSRWLHRNDGRNYVFIYQIKSTGQFGYQTFSETFAGATAGLDASRIQSPPTP
ncbi:MAG: hypothetical protein QM755_18150 [Luteolibacter sp.]